MAEKVKKKKGNMVRNDGKRTGERKTEEQEGTDSCPCLCPGLSIVLCNCPVRCFQLKRLAIAASFIIRGEIKGQAQL